MTSHSGGEHSLGQTKYIIGIIYIFEKPWTIRFGITCWKNLALRAFGENGQKRIFLHGLVAEGVEKSKIQGPLKYLWNITIPQCPMYSMYQMVCPIKKDLFMTFMSIICVKHMCLWTSTRFWLAYFWLVWKEFRDIFGCSIMTHNCSKAVQIQPCKGHLCRMRWIKFKILIKSLQRSLNLNRANGSIGSRMDGMGS